MEYITDWLYQMVAGVFSELFTAINTLGSDLFGQPWVQQIVGLFSNLGWVLFVVGIVVALFEFAIESQSGRGDPKTLSLNIIKGFFAVNLFSVVPVQLYSLAVNMQRNMSCLMSWTVVPEGNGNLALECLEVIENALFGPILAIIIIFMFGYAVVKVFLSGLKRGGILLIQVVYVQRSQRLHGRLCHVGETGHSAVPDHIPAVGYDCLRADSVQGSMAHGAWCNACSG